jgi:hypothetical protein
MAAVEAPEDYRMKQQSLMKWKQGKDVEEIRLQDKVNNEQFTMDSYNQFSISVRGSLPEVYSTAQGRHCETLLAVTMPLPTEDNILLQHMQPAECLGDTSTYTAWMSEYVRETEDEDAMDFE